MAAILSCYVNVNYDPTVGMLSHNFLLAPPKPVPNPMPSIEMICMQMWTLGYVTGQNKFTSTVKHNNWDMIIEGHDIGMMIPDITIPFVNQYYVISWPFSSRKLTFETSMVKMDGKMVGCSQAFIPLPMMTCGDPISAPTTLPILNWLNTVQVGLSLLDLIMGIIGAVVSMAIDYIFEKLPPEGKFDSLFMDFLGKMVPLSPKAWAKKLISTLAGTALSAADPRRPAKVDLKVGMPGIAEGGIEVTSGDASVGASLFGGKDNRVGMGEYAEGHVVHDANGTRAYATGQEAGQQPWTLGTAPSGS